jgi:hypothetical protein
MALTEGKGLRMTFSYPGSLRVVPSALFDCTDTAVLFAFFLFKKIAITVKDATAPTNKAIARQLKDIIYTRLVTKLFIPIVSMVLELCVS